GGSFSGNSWLTGLLIALRLINETCSFPTAQKYLVEFILNGRLHKPTNADGNQTLLDYVRGEAKLKGTKEGCASGDCGACSVLVATSPGGPLRAINACITPLGNLNKCHVFTVEALAEGGSLHPVQQAM